MTHSSTTTQRKPFLVIIRVLLEQDIVIELNLRREQAESVNVFAFPLDKQPNNMAMIVPDEL